MFTPKPGLLKKWKGLSIGDKVMRVPYFTIDQPDFRLSLCINNMPKGWSVNTSVSKIMWPLVLQLNCSTVNSKLIKPSTKRLCFYSKYTCHIFIIPNLVAIKTVIRPLKMHESTYGLSLLLIVITIDQNFTFLCLVMYGG